MKIYLDPHIEGCTVWFSDGNIQSLKGDIRNICKRIKDFVVITKYDYQDNPVKYQKIKVYLDTMGIGVSYGIELEAIKVKFERCTYQKII